MASPCRLDIDPDIAAARQPPAALYREPAWQDALASLVLGRSWHCVGVEQLAEGEVAATTLLPEILDDPLVQVGLADGGLRTLSNACTHRGALVVPPDAPRSSPRRLRCPYHGRRFDLSGHCTARPGFEGLPWPSDHLPELPGGALGPLRFAARDPVLSLDRWLAPARDILSPEILSTATPTASADFEVHAHWALYVDNYLEGLHIPFVHPGLSAALDLSDYRVELLPWASLQLGLPSSERDPVLRVPGHGDVAAAWLWLFPCTMLNVYPWGLSLNIVQPVSPRRTRVLYRFYVTDPELRDRGARAALEQVEAEDRAAVEGVAAGIARPGWRGGGYAPEEEAAVHHFHRLLARCLSGEVPDDQNSKLIG